MEAHSTRDHLIEVGLQQMRKTGYASTGVKEILEFAGVPKGSFYHYFPSKEAFGEIVMRKYLEAEYARMNKFLSNSKLAPLKCLRKYFEELISIYGPRAEMNGGCLLGNFSQEVANHSVLMQKVLHEGFEKWQAAIEKVLQEAITQGAIAKQTDIKKFSSFILNSYEGALLRAKAEQNEAPLRLFLNMIFDLLLTSSASKSVAYR